MEAKAFKRGFAAFCGEGKYQRFLTAVDKKRGRLLAWQEILLERFVEKNELSSVPDLAEVCSLFKEELDEIDAVREARERIRQATREAEEVRRAQEEARREQEAAQKALQEELKRRIFICYAREDREFAKRLHEDLTAKGYKTWVDFINLLPGQTWRETISKAIQESGYFVACLSSNSLTKRGFSQAEIREALQVAEEMSQEEIFLIPARIDECLPASPRLRELQWVDFFPSYQVGFRKLLKGLHQPAIIDLSQDPWYIEGFINANPWHVTVRKSPATIGRDSSRDIALPSAAVSSEHACLVSKGDFMILYDLGSTNGTYINNQRVIGEQALVSGDIVIFADLKFRISKEPIITLALTKTTTFRLDMDHEKQREDSIRKLAGLLGHESPDFLNNLVRRYRRLRDAEDKEEMRVDPTMDSAVEAKETTGYLTTQASNRLQEELKIESDG